MKGEAKTKRAERRRCGDAEMRKCGRCVDPVIKERRPFRFLLVGLNSPLTETARPVTDALTQPPAPLQLINTDIQNMTSSIPSHPIPIHPIPIHPNPSQSMLILYKPSQSIRIYLIPIHPNPF